MDRRQFLRGAGVAAASTAAASDAVAAPMIARETFEMPPDALGMLYDSTICIGCKACVEACKVANGMPDEIPREHEGWNLGQWDTAQDLSGKTLNVIKAYRDGTMAEKDREIDGFAFMKRHCLHCVDPSCVSVCPVSAMQKDPQTGLVSYNVDACIGCRFCVYGCPFGVPQFDIDGPFGRINKCEMCRHLLDDGGFPACCDVCPTGASLFGLVEELQAETERRLAAEPGSTYQFPRGWLGHDRPTYEGTIAEYQPAVYGVDEGGGTQVRYIAGVPFEKLGLPDLPKYSFAAVSEGVQHTLYNWLILPLVGFGALAVFARRHTRKDADVHDGELEEHAMSPPAPLRRNFVSPMMIVLALLAAIGFFFIGQRFIFGLGAVTNINPGYPWGIWVVVDIVVGTAFGCGGFAMALLVYIFNRGDYHPLVRPALLGGLFGYTLAGMAVMIDLGRYWQFYTLMLPWYAQPNSVMFEVALCVMAYVLVLWIEFSPAVFERLGLTRLRELVQRYMFVVIALGVLLPAMHQSSLGSILLVLGSQLSPLWYTVWLPLLFVTSALAMGYAVVVFEATVVSEGFDLPSEHALLSKLSIVVGGILVFWMALRWYAVASEGAIDLAFETNLDALMFWLENLLFLFAIVALLTPFGRASKRFTFLGAVALLLGGSLYRLNAYLIAYTPPGDWAYFPSVPELMVTIGVVALEILLYLVFVTIFPVLAVHAAPARRAEVTP